MSPYAFSSFLSAITPLGLANILSNGFGISAPVPDTAAFVDGPSDLLSAQILSSYTLADLQLDTASAVPMTGNFTLKLPDATGLSVVSWSATLTPSVGTTPLAIALYNAASGVLFYIAAYYSGVITSPALPVQVSGKVTLGATQCAS